MFDFIENSEIENNFYKTKVVKLFLKWFLNNWDFVKEISKPGFANWHFLQEKQYKAYMPIFRHILRETWSLHGGLLELWFLDYDTIAIVLS